MPTTPTKKRKTRRKATRRKSTPKAASPELAPDPTPTMTETTETPGAPGTWQTIDEKGSSIGSGGRSGRTTRTERVGPSSPSAAAAAELDRDLEPPAAAKPEPPPDWEGFCRFVLTGANDTLKGEGPAIETKPGQSVWVMSPRELDAFAIAGGKCLSRYNLPDLPPWAELAFAAFTYALPRLVLVQKSRKARKAHRLVGSPDSVRTANRTHGPIDPSSYRTGPTEHAPPLPEGLHHGP